MRYYIYTTFNALLLAVFTPLIVITTLLLPLKWSLHFSKIYNWFVIVILYPLAANCKITIIGLDNIPKTPYIAMSHHSSMLETFILFYYLQPLTVVVKKSLLKIPLFGWCLAMVKPIAIDRNKKRQAFQQIIDQGKKRLQQNLNILLFPEGTRYPHDKIKKLNRSGFKLASETNTPIVPIMHNAGYAWPPRQRFKPGVDITVIIGKPIDCKPEQLTECHNLVQQWFEQQHQKLTSQP